MTRHLRKIILLILGVIFIILIFNFFDFKTLDFHAVQSNYFNWKVIVCIGFYLISHCIRSLRLYIISGDINASLNRVFNEQFKTNGVNLTLPFKLGEAYRFVRFKKVFKSGFTSANTIVIERFFDFVILAFLFTLGLIFFPNEIVAIHNTLMTIMLVLALLLVTVLSLEDIMLIIHKRLLYRFDKPYGFPVLKFTYQFLRNFKEAKKVLKSKSLTIVSLTILVWFFELLSLFMFFNDLDHRIDLIILLMVFIAFSSLLPNGPLGFGGVQLSFYTIFLLHPAFDHYLIASTAYTLYIFGSAITISVVLFILNIFKNPYEK